MRRPGVVLLIGLVLGACSLGGPDEDATGEEIYADLCARCHSDDLSGGVGPPLGQGSNSAGEDDEYLEFTILNGRGRMPSFASLDDAQVARLIDYMREVQGQ